MTYSMTEMLIACGSLLSTSLYITYQWFLTAKVKCNLSNPLLSLLMYCYCIPYRAAVMADPLLGKTRSGWPRRARAYQHPVLDFDCEKKSICMHPMWLKRSMLHPHYPALELWPATNYWSSVSVAAELPWLSRDILAGLQAFFHVQYTRNKNIFDKKTIRAAEVVLETHWGHFTGSWVKKVYEITGNTFCRPLMVI